MILKIISGGQAGADQGGLHAARMLDIPTGGWAPKGWTTELGSMRVLLEEFGLKECKVAGYPVRTVMNVKESTGTVIFGRLNSAGSKLTSDACQINKKPCIHFDVPWNMQARKQFFLDWIVRENIEVLNVAGNRESKNPGIEISVIEFLVETLG